MKRPTSNHLSRAFTLLEILLVVLILGVLAAMVIPQFVDASDETQESAVRQSLQTLREQIRYYHFHENAYPADLQALVDAGYLSSYPEHPGNNGNWVYNAADGTVTSSVNPAW